MCVAALNVPLRRRFFSPICPRIQPFMNASIQGRAQGFSLGPRPRSRKSRPKAESEVGLLGRGSKPPPHQLGGPRERCQLPKRGSGSRSYDRPKFSHYFQRSG